MQMTKKEIAILNHVFLLALDSCSKNGGDFARVLSEHKSSQDPCRAVMQVRDKVLSTVRAAGSAGPSR